MHIALSGGEEASAEGIAWRLLIVLLLVAANGFFVAVEFVVVSASGRRTRLEQMARKGDKKAQLVLKAFLEDPDRVIAASQVGITVASLAIGWIGEPAFEHLITPLLESTLGVWLPWLAAWSATAISLGVITVIHTVLGEQVPKTVAVRQAEGLGKMLVNPMRVFNLVARPFITLLDWLTDHTLRLIGQPPLAGHRTVYSVDELGQLIQESHEEGVLEQEQMVMARKVLRFADMRIREVMIPRIDVVGVEQSSTVRELLEVFRTHSHARFPVYKGNLDNIIGIVSVKDVLLKLGEDAGALDRTLEELALTHPTMVMVENQPVNEVLEQMRGRQAQMALILDEYGGTAGVVTAEEIVEEIVGQLSDELFSSKPDVEKLSDGVYKINAQLRVEDVNEELGLSIPANLDEYETLAGFLLVLMRRVPREGDTVRHGQLCFKIARMKGPKIEEVIMEFRGKSER